MTPEHNFIELCLDNFREVDMGHKPTGQVTLRRGREDPPRITFIVYNKAKEEPHDGVNSLLQPLVALTEEGFQREFSDLTEKLINVRRANWLTTELAITQEERGRIQYFVSGLTLVVIKDDIHCLFRMG